MECAKCDGWNLKVYRYRTDEVPVTWRIWLSLRIYNIMRFYSINTINIIVPLSAYPSIKALCPRWKGRTPNPLDRRLPRSFPFRQSDPTTIDSWHQIRFRYLERLCESAKVYLRKCNEDSGSHYCTTWQGESCVGIVKRCNTREVASISPGNNQKADPGQEISTRQPVDWIRGVWQELQPKIPMD